MRRMAVVATLLLALGGCANTSDNGEQIEELESRVDDLEKLVTQMSEVVLKQAQQPQQEPLPGCGNLAALQAQGRVCEGPMGPEVMGDGLGGF